MHYAVALSRSSASCSFFFNDTATTEIYTLSLHDALPISTRLKGITGGAILRPTNHFVRFWVSRKSTPPFANRSEEHTSELQSRPHLVCRLLLGKKKATLTHSERSPPRRRTSHRCTYSPQP